MVDFTKLIDGHAYRAFGVQGMITPVDGAPVAVRVIDGTGPVEELTDSDHVIKTVRPMATVRMVEILAKGITRKSVSRAELEMNGKRFRINATEPRPSNRGEADGELELFLSELDVRPDEDDSA